jgi:tyrosyl-tRNA synthetase
MSLDNIVDVLAGRGMVEQVAGEDGLRGLLSSQGTSIYVGFDPTADSLHVGHLLPILILAHFQRAGHRPIIVVGGATGMIGDPSGRSTERQLLTPDMVAENASAMRRQLEQFVSFEGANAAVVVDNGDWIRPMSHLEWLRVVGKHFSVNYMLAKESVRRRLEEREQGISYTEFSYMLLQAYDFLHLFKEYGCRIQGGGSDQWGNITAGIDLIRKVRSEEAFGITFPLLSTTSGEKFGKSAGNAIWLDQQKTSPYQFYQFWLRTEDADVERFLKLFTFLNLEEVESVCKLHRVAPEKRAGQRRLAAEVTSLVHGDDGLERAVRASEVLFGREISNLSDAELSEVFVDVPSLVLARSQLEVGIKLTDLLVQAGACGSKSEATRLVRGGGVYLNNRRIESSEITLRADHLASESMLILRLGKKSFHVARFE